MPLTKETCSPCLRGSHRSCTTPEACKCLECYPPPPPKFVWEDPPDGRGTRTLPMLDEDLLAELRGHPKRWARVKTFASKTSANGRALKIRKGDDPHLPPSEWEAVGRKVGTGSALYLRYVGEVSA